MATTWFEEGMEKGERAMVERAITHRFGELSDELRERFTGWPSDRLGELLDAVIGAETIDDLPLYKSSGE